MLWLVTLGQTNVDVEWLPIPKMICKWWVFHIYISLQKATWTKYLAVNDV